MRAVAKTVLEIGCAVFLSAWAVATVGATKGEKVFRFLEQEAEQ